MPLPTALGPAGRGNAPNRPVQAPLAASTSQAGPVRHRGRFQRRGIFKADRELSPLRSELKLIRSSARLDVRLWR